MTQQATVLETISPKRAQEYLAANTSNRTIRPLWVDTLCRSITEGRWHTTHQGIAFNCDGTLLDGQHRLHAIIKAGKSVKMNVTRGMPRESMYAIDCNKSRTPKDCAGPLGLGIEITRTEVAIARAMVNGIGRGNAPSWTMTNEEIIKFIARHEESIQFAATLCLGDCRNATVQGVLARAWYSSDRARLAAFADILRTSVCESKGDRSAICFRDYFLKLPGGRGSTGVRIAIAKRCEAAVRAFLKSDPITKLYEVKNELFLIPGEGLNGLS